jgi:putative ATP-binding cassette transporter
MPINPNSALFSFLLKESPRELKKMGLLALLVGMTNTLLIGLINTTAKDVSTGKEVTLQFFEFSALLIAFLIFTQRSNRENISNTNALIYRFKIRIMSQAFKSNLTKIDKIGRDYVMDVLARDTQLVSSSMSALLSAFQSISTLFFLILYMSTVSITASLIILIASVFIFTIGLTELSKLTHMLQTVWSKEAEVTGIYSAFLNGYKEVKMDSRRALAITQELVNESEKITQSKTKILIALTNFFNYLQGLLYLVVGAMIFVIPVFASDFSAQVTTAAATALFLTGSVTAVIMNISNISMANVAAKSLSDLVTQLELKETENAQPGEARFSIVDSIELADITYTYRVDDGFKTPFSIGPIDYIFEKGKVYFIRGNNGSGKTTFMRVLIGLYQPCSGRLLVNGSPIAEPANASYRDIFSVVFSDFYLFKKLYGLPKCDDKEVQELLSLFQMEDKVIIKNGEFSDLNFSTGQRKRLALLVALLEKKQFIVLDEWAADQDPEFRQEFYETIIPKLREMGKTVIAITHDQQYYEIADHVIYMTNGKPASV